MFGPRSRRLEGTSLLELNGSAVQRALAPLTDVSTASYDRAFPHTLRVLIRPETPVAVRGAGRRRGSSLVTPA